MTIGLPDVIAFDVAYAAEVFAGAEVVL